MIYRRTHGGIQIQGRTRSIKLYLFKVERAVAVMAL
jgi:hypothetical protein